MNGTKEGEGAPRFNVYDGDELVLSRVPADNPLVLLCAADQPLRNLAVGGETLLRKWGEVYRVRRVQ